MIDRRFIEVSFPVKEVSIESAREKNIRQGHISTLHIWWARRPLVSSRATIFATLVPATDFEEGDRFYNKFRAKLISLLKNNGFININKNSSNHELVKYFIIVLSKWENSNSPEILSLARQMILEYNKGVPPKVLDPFGGGGAIPLEAMRLGCETYSNDLNPVAVLLQKCTLEYPQRFGKSISRKQYLDDRQFIKNNNYNNAFADDDMINPLVEDIQYWGKWVLEKSEQALKQFYPADADGSIPSGYIWARTIPCQNPSCEAEIPLMKQFWLAKKTNKKIALFPFVENKRVAFKIVAEGSSISGKEGYCKMPKNYNPSNGTVARAIVTCPVCGSVIEAKKTRNLFKLGQAQQRLLVVVTHKPNSSAKTYRLADENDLKVFYKAAEYLKIKREEWKHDLGIDPVPDEKLVKTGGNQMAVLHYNLNVFGDLFNARQLASLITLSKFIRELDEKIDEAQNSVDDEYKNAIISFIALSLDRLTSRSSNISVWHNGSEQTEKIFGRQALSMQWSYPENNPFLSNNVSGFFKNILSVTSVITQLSYVVNKSNVIVNQFNAAKLPVSFKDFSAVFTDPPYYDNVYYSNLSDYFYVWLKRTLININVELFSSNLTPKKNEIVSDPIRHASKNDSKIYFEKSLTNSFLEMYRVLSLEGYAVIVYAHKSTSGWEALINSLLQSNFIILAAWPISTELNSRINATETASLASSIYFVCKKTKKIPTVFYPDVRKELNEHVPFRLERLWNEGISGADFFISAIGASIEVFGKYENVMDYEGNIIRADKLLNEVRTIVTDYAVKKILHNVYAHGISDLTRFYILFRWQFGAAKSPFDEVNKLAHSVHLDLSDYWNTRSFIKKEKEFISVAGPTIRDFNDLKGSNELIDVLHHSLKLWEAGKKEEMYRLLNETSYGQNDVFYRVAQAISETLPNEAKEKKLLDGFLVGRQRTQEKSSEKIKPDQEELF